MSDKTPDEIAEEILAGVAEQDYAFFAKDKIVQAINADRAQRAFSPTYTVEWTTVVEESYMTEIDKAEFDHVIGDGTLDSYLGDLETAEHKVNVAVTERLVMVDGVEVSS